MMLGEYGVEGEEVTVTARDGRKVGENILNTVNKENWKKGISFKQEKELGEQRWYLEAKNRQVRFDLKIKYPRSLGGLVLFEESFHNCKFESMMLERRREGGQNVWKQNYCNTLQMESKDIMMFIEKYLCTQDGRELEVNRVLRAKKVRRSRRKSSGGKNMGMSSRWATSHYQMS